MQGFKSGTRQNTTMMPFANMLNEQQAKDVSAYYSQLPVVPAAGGENATKEELLLGEKLALRGDWERYIVFCQSCHGPSNTGASAAFPGIAGQHVDYIANQLRHPAEMGSGINSRCT